MSVTDNVDLPPTLLSRFDLIYLMIDRPDETRDARLARHVVSLFNSAQGIPRYACTRPPWQTQCDSDTLCV